MGYPATVILHVAFESKAYKSDIIKKSIQHDFFVSVFNILSCVTLFSPITQIQRKGTAICHEALTARRGDILILSINSAASRT